MWWLETRRPGAWRANRFGGKPTIILQAFFSFHVALIKQYINILKSHIDPWKLKGKHVYIVKQEPCIVFQCDLSVVQLTHTDFYARNQYGVHLSRGQGYH